MRYGIVLDEAFTRHLNPVGHPERPERITAIMRAFEAWEGRERVTRYSPTYADPEWIGLVHSEHHCQMIKATAGHPHHSLDPDTHTGPHSFETAMLAAGSGVKLTEMLCQGKIDAGFLLARPPGHHAERERAMGFCLFNNLAIAAEWAIQSGYASRVAVVDFDIHHGNGTQQKFYARSDVLYISTHQYPFYPGSGHFSEKGEGAGLGYTVNLPLRAGLRDYFFSRLYRELVVPILHEFEPHLVLVSAGYDGHSADPLAGMELSTMGYGNVASTLTEVAAQITAGRILYFLEGGYDLRALSACVLRTIEAGLSPTPSELPESQVEEYENYRDLARGYFAPHWKCLL